MMMMMMMKANDDVVRGITTFGDYIFAIILVAYDEKFSIFEITLLTS